MLSQLSSDGFNTDFSTLIQNLLQPGGNLRPLELADLEGLDHQQLTELAAQLGIELPAELFAANDDAQALPLNLLATEISNAITKDASVMGNPNANALLKTNLVNADSVADDGLFPKQTNTTELYARAITLSDGQQAAAKKENEQTLSLVGNEFLSSEYMKKMSAEKFQLRSQALLQSVGQEGKATTLVDSLVSVDKPTNTFQSFASPALQTYANQSTSTVTSHQIQVPVQQPGWGEAVGNRLMMMVNDKVQSAKIHLNPAELGPIEVRVNINHDQASVHFVSSNSVVRDAIDDAFPRLKEMFAQNGLNLSDANVSQQSPQQRNSNLQEQSDMTTSANKENADVSDAETVAVSDLSSGLIDHYV